MDYAGSVTLADALPGIDVRVLSNRASSPAVTRRLAEMGVRAGASLRILYRTSGGGAVLAIGDDRIAVAKAILRSITVGPADNADSAGAGAPPTRSGPHHG